MTKKISIALALFLIPNTLDASENDQKRSKKESVLLVGDSLAEGMSREFLKLTKQADYVPYIHAKSGTRCQQWSTKIEKIINSVRPKLTIIVLGTNDAGSKNVEYQKTCVKKVRRTVNTYGSKILWILPRDLPSSFKGQDRLRQILIEENQKDALDTRNIDIPMSNDKIHPTILGYQLWFREIWRHLLDKKMVTQ